MKAFWLLAGILFLATNDYLALYLTERLAQFNAGREMDGEE